MLVSEIQTRVKALFGDTGNAQITDAWILDWINDGQLDIQRKTECLDAQGLTINTVAGTNSYPLTPAGLLDIRRVAYKGNPVEPTTLDRMDETYPTREVDLPSNWQNGTPQFYWVDKGVITLYPAPDATAVGGLLILYLPSPTILTAAGQTPDIPVQYHELIVRYALMRAYESDENFTAAEYVKRDYDERVMQAFSDVKSRVFDSYNSVRALPGDDW